MAVTSPQGGVARGVPQLWHSVARRGQLYVGHRHRQPRGVLYDHHVFLVCRARSCLPIWSFGKYSTVTKSYCSTTYLGIGRQIVLQNTILNINYKNIENVLHQTKSSITNCLRDKIWKSTLKLSNFISIDYVLKVAVIGV